MSGLILIVIFFHSWTWR